MVAMRVVSVETPVDKKLVHQMNDCSEKISGYERCREERIKENMERMQKLGIMDLSLKLKTTIKPPRKTPQRLSPIRPVGPVRRSSRLGNVTPISYSEVCLSKKGSFESEEELLSEGYKPEVYSEEQKMRLGGTNMSWTLFVDGYGKDGRRIYDSIKGKTCHQCRQKTLGHRTHCSQCSKVQGQFCGDCLYMRYGEHVLEAMQNPDWVCPVCRGICNCSLCRQAKGWPPTGIMYKKIAKLGFKSVAHYLLQTERQTTDLENEGTKAPFSTTDSEKEGTKVPISSKRSLAFSSLEADPKGDLKESVELKFEKDKMNEDHKGEELDGITSTGTEQVDGNVSPNIPGYAKISADVVTNKEDSVRYLEKEHSDSCVAKKTTTASKRKTPNRSEPMPDSIGARLRVRRRICS